MKDKKVAIVICNYNMFEWADELVEHIYKTVKVPYEIIFVDNGSDIVPPSKYTNYWIPENVQMIRGFMQGVRYADSLGEDFFAYWLVTTSCKFYKEYDGVDYMKVDPLELLLKVLIDDPKAYAVQSALTFNKGRGSAWRQHHEPRPARKLRRLWALENVAVLFNAEYFNKLGGWNEELTMGWGISAENFWLARKEGLHIYNHDGYVMHKETDVGYEMGRMGMTAKERRRVSSEEVKAYFTPIYGEDYYEVLNWTHRETGRGEY